MPSLQETLSFVGHTFAWTHTSTPFTVKRAGAQRASFRTHRAKHTN